MADTKYDFLKDSFFNVYTPVETPKVELKLPLFDSPIDISSWASGISESGIPIVKPKEQEQTPQQIRYTMIVDNAEEAPIYKEVEQITEEPAETQEQKQETTTSTTPLYTSSSKWQNDLVAAYKRAGLSDNAIKNLIAKNSVESNNGKSQMSKYFNFGNISVGSSWKGKQTIGDDKDAKGNPIKQKFRMYDSIDEYVKDELDLLKRVYDFNPNDDLDTFLDKLKGKNRLGYQYATAPNYKSVVKSRYKRLFA